MDYYEQASATYNNIAQLYEDKFMSMTLYDSTYDLFCERLKPDSAILEIATGPGNISRYLMKVRPDLKLLGIDSAPNMVSRARKNVPESEFRIMDFRNISELDNKFDGLICGFGIPYLSKEDCKKFIADCSSLLTDDGVIYLSFVAGDYNSSHLKTSGENAVFFHFYETAFLTEQLEKNRLKVIHNVEVDYPVKDKDPDVHNILIAVKAV